MLSRNDQPYGFNFNFAVDNMFTNQQAGSSGITSNQFLLLDAESFLLLDGTNFLLLGT